MNTQKKFRLFSAAALVLPGLLTLLSLTGKVHGEGNVPFMLSDQQTPVLSATGEPLFLGMFTSYPTDPVADIPWSCAYSGVDEIECAFNKARSNENTQLGTALPPVTLPSQTTWDGMSEGKKVLWLINQERIDRGIDPLDQVEINVTGVAQYYADYLLDNDAWGHYEDGRSPWERLDDNPEIWVCHDFLNVAENLAVFASTGTIPLPVERSLYMWMYDDSGSAWGHRHAILWYPYNDNSGTDGVEGLLGIGRASGGPYQGPFSKAYPFAEIIVMNVFDPCETWDYGPATTSSTSSSPPVSTTTTTAGIASSTSTVIISSTTTSTGPGTSTSLPSTSTTPPGSTTTTADDTPACPCEHLYGDYSCEARLLRRFRDEVLSTTPEGRQLIQLYYQLSPLVVKAMVEDKDFEGTIKELAGCILPMIEKSFR